MSYQVIARKYRPQRFSDVVGQEHVTQTLTNAINQERIAHAYLFVGPRGTGKTTIARIFAKCLNATDGPTVDFTDDDPRCQEITEGRSLDVLEIDGASNRGIEEVRELRETVKYAPANGAYKIYIIDEVHMLTKEAFNALLKTLEEPPEHVKFMFATTEPEKVLATILSRCQRFDLRRIPVTLISQHLALISKKENVHIDEAALNAIARGADGGMRDAESALDQLISFCGDTIVETDVLSMFGLTAQGQLHSLALAILNGESESVLRAITQLAKQGKDFGRLLADLLNHFRNLLIYSVSSGDLSLLEASETEAASLTEQSALATEDALTRIMEVLSDAEGKLRVAASKKIFIEVTLLKAIQARNAVSVDSLLAQLKEISASAGGAAPAPARQQPAAAPKRTAPAPTPKPPTSRAQATAPTPAASIPTTTQPSQATTAPAPAPAPVGDLSLDQLWQNLVAAVGQASAFTRSYFLTAHPVSITDKLLTIGFPPAEADQLEMVDNPKTRSLLQKELEKLGRPLSVKFVTTEDAPAPISHEPPAQAAAPVPAAPPTRPAPAPAAQASHAPQPSAQSQPKPTQPSRPEAVPKEMSIEEFKNDPLIKRALDIFKGQIVEVRT